MASFGAEVARVRKAKKLTQSSLAALVGVESGTISRIERTGKAHPGNAERIREVLGIPDTGSATDAGNGATPALLTLLIQDDEGRSAVLGRIQPTTEMLELLNAPLRRPPFAIAGKPAR